MLVQCTDLVRFLLVSVHITKRYPDVNQNQMFHQTRANEVFRIRKDTMAHNKTLVQSNMNLFVKRQCNRLL